MSNYETRRKQYLENMKQGKTVHLTNNNIVSANKFPKTYKSRRNRHLENLKKGKMVYLTMNNIASAPRSHPRLSLSRRRSPSPYSLHYKLNGHQNPEPPGFKYSTYKGFLDAESDIPLGIFHKTNSKGRAVFTNSYRKIMDEPDDEIIKMIRPAYVSRKSRGGTRKNKKNK